MKRWGLLISFIFFSASLLYADDDPASYEANADLIQTQGYVIFFDAQGPMSYATATQMPPNTVSIGLVQGEACQHGLSIPFTANLSSASGRVDGAFGSGGFLKALDSIQKKNPQLAGIFNVQIDEHQTQILSIYTRLCTEVTAFGYKLATPTTLAKI